MARKTVTSTVRTKAAGKAGAKKTSAASRRAAKYVYYFGGGNAEGRAGMKELLGGKGAGLAEMTNLGVPVPPGFTITTEACVLYYQNSRQYPRGMWEEVVRSLRRLEQEMDLRLGDPARPLLVSVRSGARVSMPGMMDTVLNLGLNDRTVEGLIRRSGNPRFAYDSYRRFIQMFGDVVMKVDKKLFEELLEARKQSRGVHHDTELTAEDLRGLVEEFKALVEEKAGRGFPEEPEEQLRMAINAVFESWNNPRAITYRRLHHIPGDWGTAVSVVAMVFGNMGEDSGTGVAFTRDPATGARRFFGEFLMNAQGEDVVAGIRTPVPIAELNRMMPGVYAELERIYQKLERHYRDMLDLEFTIQEGKLYMLQTRVGKRTARAAIKIAVDMVREKLISKSEAIMRIVPKELDQLLHPTFDPKAPVRAMAKGIGSAGAAVGKVAFTAERAEELFRQGEKVILVRNETSPEDVGGMAASEGILTARGGATSHAAVVGRGMGKCVVVGCGDLEVHEEEGYFRVKGTEIVLHEGDFISLNGNTGEVVQGVVALIEPDLFPEFETLMRWADEVRTLGVRANADTPKDARNAIKFGAEGIGLCRTEHMFFGEDRIPIVREMIMARDKEARERALERLLPFQRQDFLEIFEVMDGKPVTIRLLDPPLHEFLPKRAELYEEQVELRLKHGDEARIREIEYILARVRALEEFNPMLGHRGCRLGITFPEIYEMQVQAIFEAAAEGARRGIRVHPEVMIPLTGTLEEMRLTRESTVKVAEAVLKKAGVRVPYSVGTMIELPRAALIADQIAQEAEFFSFGTNDMTQMTFGYSRDDAAKFLPYYLEKGILQADPFQVLDQEGVGEMVRIGVERGKRTRKDLKLGICGEHGGEPSSVEFFHRVGLTYVSCSPYMLPIARLAAAQAKIRETYKGAVSSSV